MKFPKLPIYSSGIGVLFTGIGVFISGFAILGIYKTEKQVIKDREIEYKTRISQNIEKQLRETKNLVYQLLYENENKMCDSTKRLNHNRIINLIESYDESLLKLKKYDFESAKNIKPIFTEKELNEIIYCL